MSVEDSRKLQRISRRAEGPVELRRAIVVLMSGQGQAVRDITTLMQPNVEVPNAPEHAITNPSTSIKVPRAAMCARPTTSSGANSGVAHARDSAKAAIQNTAAVLPARQERAPQIQRTCMTTGERTTTMTQ